jgi:hypothetical protein
MSLSGDEFIVTAKEMLRSMAAAATATANLAQVKCDLKNWKEFAKDTERTLHEQRAEIERLKKEKLELSARLDFWEKFAQDSQNTQRDLMAKNDLLEEENRELRGYFGTRK